MTLARVGDKKQTKRHNITKIVVWQGGGVSEKNALDFNKTMLMLMISTIIQL